ncbi:DUF2169 domain-containing protein [Pseudomonadales bacterium]|nr:DUF2169 domain-containing protein [Pseudomonadales bacterium]
MKIIKPMKMGLLHRTYTIAETHQFVIKPIFFFDLFATENVLPDPEAWRRVMSALPATQPFDEVMPKPVKEVLLVGEAFSEGGKAVTELEVELSIGQLQKQLQVSGDRIWQKRFMRSRATAPAPFKSKPISWDRAFGFKDLPENPIGQGSLTQGAFGETQIALPNIEYLDQRLNSPRQKVAPAGYGPIDSQWAPRTVSNELYDQEYVDRTFPALPDNLDFARFNMAPIDQRIELSGREKFTLLNLHPDYPSIEGTLPALIPRAFVNIDKSFDEIELKLETVWFLPSVGLGALVFCGQREVSRRHAQLQVDNLMLAYESMDCEPRSVEYYEDVLNKRVDPKTSAAHVMDESQLSPQLTAEQEALQLQQHQAEVARVNLVRKNAANLKQEQISAEHGLGKVEYEAPKPVDSRLVMSPEAVSQRNFSLGPMLDYTAEQERAAQEQIVAAKKEEGKSEVQNTMSAETIREKALEKTRKRVKLNNDTSPTNDAGSTIPPRSEVITNPDLPAMAASLTQLTKKMPALQGSSSPEPLSPDGSNIPEMSKATDSLDRTIKKISPISEAASAGATDSEALNKLELVGLAAALKPQPISYLKAQDAGAVLRAAVIKMREAGEELAYRDFTGADLSGLDFSGENCEGSIFECASLEGCFFVNSNLAGASFVGAKVGKADFTNSNLSSANFSYAIGESVAFVNADLSGQVMMNSTRLQSADFTRAKLDGVMMLNSQLPCALFKDAELMHIKSTASDLSGAEFIGTTLSGSFFSDCKLRFSAWQDVSANRCVLLNSSLQFSSFFKCSLERCQLAGGSWLTGVIFVKSKLLACGFRSAAGTGISFDESAISKSDLAMTEFPGGSFNKVTIVDCLSNESNYEGSNFTNALLARTNFQDSNFTKTDLSGADFHQSDVLTAEFGEANYNDAKNIMPTKVLRLNRDRR